MRIADRYIARQIVFGTVFGVSLLTVLLVLSQIFKKIRPYLVEQGAPLSLIGEFVLLVLPFSLVFTLPWGFLASVLLSFGRLSSHHELVSLRMSGLSLYRIAMPALIVGLLFSGLSYYMTGTIAPRAKSALRDLPFRAAEADPSVLLNPGVAQAQFPGQRVFIESRDGLSLRGLHLYQLSDDSRDATPVAYVYADQVDLNVDREKKLFSLTLTDAYIENQNEDGSVDPVTAAEAKPWFLDYSSRRKKKFRASDLTNAGIAAALRDGSLPPKDHKELIVEINSRRSISLACFAFALIGVPLGISARRKETSTGLVLSLVVAGAYFSGMLFIDPLEESPLPVIIAILWVPNVICLALGAWLFRRASHR